LMCIRPAFHKLSKTEQRYSQFDREALAIAWSVKKFHTCLYGRHFELLTDHQPLVSIFNPSKSLLAMTTARLQQYAVFLAGHQYYVCVTLRVNTGRD
ncbi:MAG: RNase H-like domain-containing protein, partial [Pseudomonadota bacterium]